MTNKQKLFVKAKLDNPKISNTEAAMQAYDVNNRRTASVLGHKVANKPSIIMALGQHNDLFESAIVNTVRDWQGSDTPRKREIALNAAMFGHDKVHGKATVKMETTSSIVKININLTGDGDDSPPPELLDDPGLDV